MKRLYQTDYFAHLFHQELPPLLELWQIRVHAHLCRSVSTAHAWKRNLVGIAIGGPNTGGDGVDSRIEAPDTEIGENGICFTLKLNTNKAVHILTQLHLALAASYRCLYLAPLPLPTAFLSASLASMANRL